MKGNALIHYIKYLLGIEKPETQTTANERKAIKKYATNAMLAVEIGVFEGVNTVIIAEALHPEGKLFGIDPFFKGRLGICYHEKITRNAISRGRLQHKIKLLSLLSYNAVDEVTESIDFIFIDAPRLTNKDDIIKDAINIFAPCDSILIPTQSSSFSTDSMFQFLPVIKEIEKQRTKILIKV